MSDRGRRQWLLALCLNLSAAAANAQLRIEVTSGVVDPIPVAVAPLVAADAETLAALGTLDLAGIIRRDLESSGRFRALAPERMPADTSGSAALIAADWRARGVDYLVRGRVSREGLAGFAIDYELVGALVGQTLITERVVTPNQTSAWRNAAHRVADRVYERILGVRGAFATRVAYVSVDGAPPTQSYQLIVADADGEGPRVVLESRQPLMSPAWSPDGEWLAYVSFESGAAAIYVQQLRTGERRRVSARVGVNGAPAWAPDGQRMALTLSGSSGNLDLYLLELASQKLTRLTDDLAIDTEPVWSPDGVTLYFTSDRAGAPQVYRMRPGSSERPQRVTFGVGYAARPRVSPDGRQLAFVTRESGAFRIAIQELESGQVRTLTRGRLDESPSFAPNGALLIYAGRERGAATLATVSVDGLTGQRLRADRGEVRDPAWGPFAR